jgi:hypothetical protein
MPPAPAAVPSMPPNTKVANFDVSMRKLHSICLLRLLSVNCTNLIAHSTIQDATLDYCILDIK